MLVIISDLHLKDGTSGASITTDAFRVFAGRLRDQAYRASHRTGSKSYQPIEVIDLVLLGDVFDQIRSVKWLEEDGRPVSIRPWDDPNSPEFIRKIQTINDDTLKYNTETFEIFRHLSEGKLVTLPPAVRGVPDEDASERIPVKVRIHYMVGNHDWFFHLPGQKYNEMRQNVIDAMGLANPASPFPYAPADSPTLEDVLARHKVFARHGDYFDKMNYDATQGRNAATLGDALAVELLDRFPFEVKKQMGDVLPHQFSEGLKELSNVRPALVTPLWIGNLVNRYVENAQHVDDIKAIWDDLVERFIDLDFVRSHDQKFKFDIVDAMEGILHLSKGLPFETLNRMMGWMGEKLWGNQVSIAKHALEEEAFKKRAARYIVYGHTHFHEVVPLDTSLLNDEIFDQIYMNSGTWHSYHNLTLHDPSQHKFIGMQVMTYLTFFQDDEREGHPFESWSGSLAMPTG